MFLARTCVSLVKQNTTKVLNQSAIRSLSTLPSVNKPLFDSRKNELSQRRQVATVKTVAAERTSLLTRVLNKLPFLKLEKSKLAVAGYILYESIADKISYADFFEEFSLPDTFYSWFVVTELHIWLLTVRCMAEGDDGKFVRNKMIQALWSDVGLRAKKIGAVNPSETRMQVQELSEQFQAALIAYDEGLQSDDMVLAGALWRRMYQQGAVDPEDLNDMIKYIRRQIRLLDGVPREVLFSPKFSPWESLSIGSEKNQ